MAGLWGTGSASADGALTWQMPPIRQAVGQCLRTVAQVNPRLWGRTHGPTTQGTTVRHSIVLDSGTGSDTGEDGGAGCPDRWNKSAKPESRGGKPEHDGTMWTGLLKRNVCVQYLPEETTERQKNWSGRSLLQETEGGAGAGETFLDSFECYSEMHVCEGWLKKKIAKTQARCCYLKYFCT